MRQAKGKHLRVAGTIEAEVAYSPTMLGSEREEVIRKVPLLRAEAARCAATNDDEHAVSVVKHGPVSPSAYESRPDSTDSAPAVAECA